MTRDEVLTEVNKAAELFDGLAMDCCDEPGRVRWESRAAALRAAAEIIRESGWRLIAEAPEYGPVTCGKHLPRGGDWLVYRFFSAAHAAKEGYTHYLAEPAPPAREVENGGE